MSKEKAAILTALLNQLFPHPQIPLHHQDSFTLLIAVLLSAQCTDERVNSLTPQLFALASTPQEMAQLPVEQIEKIIRPLGLSHNKATAISLLSRQLVEKHRGKVPQNRKALENLPGVGRKTASVVLAQAFGKAAFPVDTHIYRCAHRWGLSKGKTVVAVEKDLKALFPKTRWNLLHLQIILYARAFCPARGHKKELCPICRALAPSELSSPDGGKRPLTNPRKKRSLRVQKAKSEKSRQKKKSPSPRP